MRRNGITSIHGAGWCFCGRHLSAALPDEDLCRVPQPGTELEIVEEEEGSLWALQRRLDGLPVTHPGLRKLTIQGCHNDGDGVRLSARLPELRLLHVYDLGLRSLTLTEATTPRLAELHLRNVSGDCRFEVSLPAVRRMQLHHLEQKEDVVNAMLAAATQLEEFDSYKLCQRVSHLRFAGNELRVLRIHRSDCL